jgi:peptide/nickel transport system ATP-binding protein
MDLEELLRVENLKTYFHTKDGVVRAVDGVDFKIGKGEILGLLGESGSGKTTIAFSILGIIPYMMEVEKGVVSVKVKSRGEIVDGKIIYKGKNLLKLSQEEMRKLRGKEISMIFQNPIDAMHPMMIIGEQVGEPVEVHEQERSERIKELVFEYLGKVDIADAQKRYFHDPHRFSGGEGQRIMIAMALICGPSLLIADEPTSSLDVLVQSQVLRLIEKIKKDFDLSVLLITHNAGLIAQMSDSVATMCGGKIMEYGDVVTIFKKARHPYTRGLLAAIPSTVGEKKELRGIPGELPNPLNPPPGCRFHPRCSYAEQICKGEEPKPIEVEPGHLVSCLRAHEIE